MTSMQEAFSTIFEECRKQAGLTQQELADQTGLTIATICHYENAKRFPSVDRMAIICEAMGTTMASFWSRYDLYMYEKSTITIIPY